MFQSTHFVEKTLLTLLFVILTLSFCLTSLPNACASVSTSQQNGLSILTNVVGLNLTKYMLTTNTYPQNTSSLLGVGPQENIEYNLTSCGSELSVLCTFTNGSLQMLQVIHTTGSPILDKSATANGTVGLAENFLSNYQTYTAGSIYGQLESTLSNVDGSKNITTTSGNTQLDVTTLSNGYTIFKWTYSINGVLAPSKFVALGFNNDSLLYFVDNWQFYTIGSTIVNLSENDAEAIALSAAENHS